MSRVANRFTDPRTGSWYDWPLNHDTEEPWDKTRNIDATANTGHVGLVRQEGAADPLVIKVAGTILQKAQYDAFWGWFELSGAQTVYYQEFTGDIYEVKVTAFRPQKMRGVNVRGGVVNPLWYWRYVLEMQVIRVIVGPPISP